MKRSISKDIFYISVEILFIDLYDLLISNITSYWNDMSQFISYTLARLKKLLFDGHFPGQPSPFPSQG